MQKIDIIRWGGWNEQQIESFSFNAQTFMRPHFFSRHKYSADEINSTFIELLVI